MRLPPISLSSPVAVLSIAGALTLATGCGGPDCNNTCQSLFSEGQVTAWHDGESIDKQSCGLEVPGRNTTELLTECVKECEGALDKPGDVGSYDYTSGDRPNSSDSIRLTTDLQAAAWMDCVWETSCEYLDQGYCPPTAF